MAAPGHIQPQAHPIPVDIRKDLPDHWTPWQISPGIFSQMSTQQGQYKHVGVKFLQKFLRKVSQNGSKDCYFLKMDIKRFFDSVDQITLKSLIRKRIKDDRVLKLTDLIIDSFVFREVENRKVGIPLGNVTSQLFANIYLHELDMFVKHAIRKKYYLRYSDDWIFVSNQKIELYALIPLIRKFLREDLYLEVHPKKIIIRSLHQGIDFLGHILFLNHRTIRTRTKQRMKKRLNKKYSDYLDRKISNRTMDQSLQSYLGILSHANQHEFSQALKNAYWIRGRLV